MSGRVEFTGVWKRYFFGGLSRGDAIGALRSWLSRDDRGDGQFWALRDVSFAVAPGEMLGLIGANGAGKTTILRILSRITTATRGGVVASGRMGALINLGAGFHRELTGRENVYLSGVILGMTRREVAQKLDRIVEFAELADFIDVPVKKYSAGMYARLGFSVAAHVDPQILLVDEVLAVGDLNFALKCHRWMSDFRRQGGTVVFVSHSMQHVRNSCTRALWLDRGQIKSIGSTVEVVDAYEAHMLALRLPSAPDQPSRCIHADPAVSIESVEFLDATERPASRFHTGDPLTIRIHFSTERRLRDPIFAFGVRSDQGVLALSAYSHFDGVCFGQLQGSGYVDYQMPRLQLSKGRYTLTVNLSEEDNNNVLEWHQSMYSFDVVGGDVVDGVYNPYGQWRHANAKRREAKL